MEFEALRQMPNEGWVLVALVVVVLVTIHVALAKVGRALRRARIRSRVLRAGEGEQRAAVWLEDLGFEILGAQVMVDHSVAVDHELVTVELRADYLVARDGKRFVVEVKTGQVAPRVETTATRRQLLEYRVAFDVDGILLIDAEAGRVQTVTFPRLG